MQQLHDFINEINEKQKPNTKPTNQLEIQGLRGQVVQVDQQLRMVSSPAYSAMDRDKALAEQNVSSIPRFNYKYRLHQTLTVSLT